MTTLSLPRNVPAEDVNLKRDFVAALVTGQVAGLIMAVAMVGVFTLVLGKPFYFPVQLIGSVVFGDAALVGFNLPAFVAGLVIHQAGASLLWSLPFGLLIDKGSPTAINVALAGLGIGLLSQVIDVSLVVPIVMNSLHGHDLWAEHVPSVWSWTAHAVFGLSFLLFIPIRANLPQATR